MRILNILWYLVEVCRYFKISLTRKERMSLHIFVWSLAYFLKNWNTNFPYLCKWLGLPNGSVVKNLPASAGDAGDMGLILGSGRSPEEGNGNPLWYSSQGNPLGRGAWQSIAHGVKKSWTHGCMYTVGCSEPAGTPVTTSRSTLFHFCLPIRSGFLVFHL